LYLAEEQIVNHRKGVYLTWEVGLPGLGSVKEGTLGGGCHSPRELPSSLVYKGGYKKVHLCGLDMIYPYLPGREVVRED